MNLKKEVLKKRKKKEREVKKERENLFKNIFKLFLIGYGTH